MLAIDFAGPQLGPVTSCCRNFSGVNSIGHRYHVYITNKSKPTAAVICYVGLILMLQIVLPFNRSNNNVNFNVHTSQYGLTTIIRLTPEQTSDNYYDYYYESVCRTFKGV